MVKERGQCPHTVNDAFGHCRTLYGVNARLPLLLRVKLSLTLTSRRGSFLDN